MLMIAAVQKFNLCRRYFSGQTIPHHYGSDRRSDAPPEAAAPPRATAIAITRPVPSSALSRLRPLIHLLHHVPRRSLSRSMVPHSPPIHLLTADLSHSPYVILNDFGGAFAMGAIGGGIWHGIKGARNSPRVRGFPHRRDVLRTPSHGAHIVVPHTSSSSSASCSFHPSPHSRASASSAPSQQSKPAPPSSAGTSASGAGSSRRSTARSRGTGRRRIRGTRSSPGS